MSNQLEELYNYREIEQKWMDKLSDYFFINQKANEEDYKIAFLCENSDIRKMNIAQLRSYFAAETLAIRKKQELSLQKKLSMEVQESRKRIGIQFYQDIQSDAFTEHLKTLFEMLIQNNSLKTIEIHGERYECLLVSISDIQIEECNFGKEASNLKKQWSHWLTKKMEHAEDGKISIVIDERNLHFLGVLYACNYSINEFLYEENQVLHELIFGYLLSVVLKKCNFIDRSIICNMQKIGYVLEKPKRGDKKAYFRMCTAYGNEVLGRNIFMDYGKDALHMYELFMSPLTHDIRWEVSGLSGMFRYLKRVHKFIVNQQVVTEGSDKDPKISEFCDEINQKISSQQWNTAISCLMKFSNYCMTLEQLSKEHVKGLLNYLCIFAPYLGMELYEKIEPGYID